MVNEREENPTLARVIDRKVEAVRGVLSSVNNAIDTIGTPKGPEYYNIDLIVSPQEMLSRGAELTRDELVPLHHAREVVLPGVLRRLDEGRKLSVEPSQEFRTINEAHKAGAMPEGLYKRLSQAEDERKFEPIKDFIDPREVYAEEIAEEEPEQPESAPEKEKLPGFYKCPDGTIISGSAGSYLSFLVAASKDNPISRQITKTTVFPDESESRRATISSNAVVYVNNRVGKKHGVEIKRLTPEETREKGLDEKQIWEYLELTPTPVGVGLTPVPELPAEPTVEPDTTTVKEQEKVTDKYQAPGGHEFGGQLAIVLLTIEALGKGDFANRRDVAKLAFPDDSVAVAYDKLARALDRLRTEGPKYGLEVEKFNPDKEQREAGQVSKLRIVRLGEEAPAPVIEPAPVLSVEEAPIPVEEAKAPEAPKTEELDESEAEMMRRRAEARETLPKVFVSPVDGHVFRKDAGPYISAMEGSSPAFPFKRGDVSALVFGENNPKRIIKAANISTYLSRDQGKNSHGVRIVQLEPGRKNPSGKAGEVWEYLEITPSTVVEAAAIVTSEQQERQKEILVLDDAQVVVACRRLSKLSPEIKREIEWQVTRDDEEDLNSWAGDSDQFPEEVIQEADKSLVVIAEYKDMETISRWFNAQIKPRAQTLAAIFASALNLNKLDLIFSEK